MRLSIKKNFDTSLQTCNVLLLSKTRPKRFLCGRSSDYHSNLGLLNVRLLNYATFGLEMLILSQFHKLIKNTNCRDPKFLFSFLIRGKVSLQVVVILIVFWCWRTEFQSRENATDRNNLTFDLDYLSEPLRSNRFFSWTCFRALNSFMLSWFFNGILLVHQVVGLENCMRPLFVDGSG